MDGSISLSPEMLLVLALAGFAMVMFSLEWMRNDVTALIVLVALGITGLVPIDRLFDGFAGNAVMAILATMILGAGLDRTGVLSLAAKRLLKAARGHEKRLMLLLCAMSGGVSAFMQNPAVAALFLPVASRLSNRTGLPLARLLLPMATCIMLGGTITMVGNSPQILLNDLIESANRNLPPGAAAMHAVEPFAIAPIGLVLLAAGLAYFWFFADRVLPREDEGAGATPERTESYFANAYGIEGEVFETTVTRDSPLVGQSIGEFEATPGAPLLLALKTGEDARLSPPGDQMLWIGSVLGVMGERDFIHAWAAENSLRVLPRLRNFGDMFNPARAGIAEVVIPPTSRYINKTIAELRLRTRHAISVLAINRGDRIFRDNVREVAIRQGDTLVLHGLWNNLSQAAEEHDFVVVTDYPKEEQRPHKLWNALGFFALGMVLALVTDLPLAVALLVGAIGMLVTGVLNMDEAYRAINWKTIFLMACLIPLGWAMDATGAAAWTAQELIRGLDDVPGWTLQLAVAVLTAVLSQVISNVGATVVMVPMAVNLALAADADPLVFAMLVVLSASNNFLSTSNPTLAIVAGPAGYRASDLWRSGVPMSLIYLVLSMLMVNWVF